jgi:hypothetical protein
MTLAKATNDTRTAIDRLDASVAQRAEPIPSPGSDPTNPYRQEAVGDWVANEQASYRRNTEPGMTDRERGERKY